jgi:arylsulfatase A-like enzyme
LTRRAGSTTEAALRWIDQHDSKPFFLFVHYFDPHLRYDPPLPFRRRFADVRDVDSDDYIFGTVNDMVNLRQGLVKLDPDKIARLEKLHNGEIAYTDAEVGKLLDGISERNLNAGTIIVITADHGEEFYDHKGFEHGHTLYDELLHIPLIIRAPGPKFMQTDIDVQQARGLSVRTIVRQIDIAPTLCELTGIQPDPGFMGESLVSLLKGRKGKDRAVLSQGNMWGPSGNSWRKDGFKLIQQSSKGPLQLFDIKADSREQNNLATELPHLRDKMTADLHLILQTVSRQHSPGQAPILSEHEIERLRSLGYVK